MRLGLSLRCPGVPRLERQSGQDLGGREDGDTLHGHRANRQASALDDGDDDLRLTPVVGKPDVRGADDHIRVSLAAVERGEGTDVLVELRFPKHARAQKAGQSRTHLRLQPLRGEGPVSGESDGRDYDPGSFRHLEANRPGIALRAQRPADANEVETGLPIGGLDLARADADLCLVHRARVPEGEARPEGRFAEPRDSGKLHRIRGAELGVERQVDAVRGLIPRRLRDGHPGFKASLVAERLLQGLDAPPDDRVAVLGAGLQPELRSERGRLGRRDAPERHTADPGTRTRFDDERDIAPTGRGLVRGSDRYPGGEEPLAGVRRQHTVARPFQWLRARIPADGEIGGIGQVHQGDAEIALPADPPDLGAPGQVKAHADAVRTRDLVHAYLREEAKGPEAVQALADGHARAGPVDEVSECGPDQLGRQLLGGDQVHAGDGLRRGAEDRGDRSQTDAEGEHGRQSPPVSSHRNLNRSRTSPPTPPWKSCSADRSSGPKIWYSTRTTRFAAPERLCE